MYGRYTKSISNAPFVGMTSASQSKIHAGRPACTVIRLRACNEKSPEKVKFPGLKCLAPCEGEKRNAGAIVFYGTN